MNPVQAITQREQSAKRQIDDARAAGVWGKPLAVLQQQLIDIRSEKRRMVETMTGQKLPVIDRKDLPPKPRAVMGIPDFLFKP
jgi:hypothetical protein